MPLRRLLRLRSAILVHRYVMTDSLLLLLDRPPGRCNSLCEALIRPGSLVQLSLGWRGCLLPTCRPLRHASRFVPRATMRPDGRPDLLDDPPEGGVLVADQPHVLLHLLAEPGRLVLNRGRRRGVGVRPP